MIICTITLAAFPAHAQFTSQLEEKTLPVGAFSSVSVGNNFEVSLVKGTYGVKLTADKDLSPYIQVYVRSKVLYISYDEKSVPKDIKKQYKGRGAPTPVFRVIATLPELNGITMEDNATLVSTDEFPASSFEMNLTEKAQVKNLTVKARTIKVNMKKNAQAALSLIADATLEIQTEGNANLKLTAEAPELVMNAAGSSDIALVSKSQTATFSMAGSAKATVSNKTEKAILQMGASSNLQLTGEGESVLVRGEKNSVVDANDFCAKKLDANLSGNARVNMSVSELIDATLVGGSALYYTGTPVIQVGKVMKSTLAPYGSTAK